MLCSRSKPISRLDAFYSAASLPHMLRKRSARRAWRYRLLCANSSDSVPGEKCSAKTLLTLRKSFNANDLIFQTVEDGSKHQRHPSCPVVLVLPQTSVRTTC